MTVTNWLAAGLFPSIRSKPTETYLENHAGGDNRGDTQLHQGTTVTGQHHTQPVQGIRGVR